MADFFKNVGRYFTFFITITLGVLYVFLERLLPFVKKPATAIALMALLLSTLVFVAFTLRAMLGFS